MVVIAWLGWGREQPRSLHWWVRVGMGQELQPFFIKVKNSTSCISLLTAPMQGSCTFPFCSCLLQGTLGALAFEVPKAFANMLAKVESCNSAACLLLTAQYFFTWEAMGMFSRLAAGAFTLCCFAAVLMVLHLWLPVLLWWAPTGSNCNQHENSVCFPPSPLPSVALVYIWEPITCMHKT